MTVVDLIGSLIMEVDVTELWMTEVDSDLELIGTDLNAWEMTAVASTG